MAHKHRLAAAIMSLGCLQAASVWGLGLGNLTLQSFLNEPLRARVDLLDVNNLHEDQIRIRLATNEDFDRMGVDRAYFLTGIKFEVEVDRDGRGYILLTSDEPVVEPYLDFIVEARWPSGRLLRNYTVLVDPPVFDERSPVVSASRRVAETEEQANPPSGSGPGAQAGDSASAVRVRASDLAPGAMPERNYGAEAAAEPQPGSRYMIRRDETLWTIAQRARPEGTTVQQSMLDIQRLNPDAFIDGNINQIKAGYIIYLPASGEITSDDAAAALAQVQQQNADWREGRVGAVAGPALRVSAGAAEPATDASAGPATQGAATGPGATPEAGTSAAVGTAAVLEDLERSQLERDELGQRLAAISERLETLERIVELKDAQIAALQQALSEAGATDGAASAIPPQEAQDAADAELAVGAAPAVPSPVTAPAEPQPPAAEPARESGNWLYVLVALAVAGLLALLFWRRRQQGGEQQGASDFDLMPAAAPAPAARSQRDAFADVQLQDESLAVEDGEEPAAPPEVEPAPAVAPVLSQRGYGERKHDQYASDVDAGDALAEADIYIAYGRFPQAMELLRNAITTDRDNSTYRLKLLELAVETGDRDEAGRQLAELQRIGDQDSVARAQSLFGGAAGLGVATASVPPPPPGGHPAPAGATAGETAAESGAETPYYLGDEPEPEPEPEPDTMAGRFASQSSGLADYSGNLSDFDSDSELESEAAYDLSEALADLQPRSGDARDELVPAIDREERPSAVADAELPADDDDALESEFLDLEIEDAPGPVEELDISTEFERTAGGREHYNDDDFVFADDGDPLATKLDLARAYIDMGDQDGAREILEEVAAEGSAEQQLEARTLMDRLV